MICKHFKRFVATWLGGIAHRRAIHATRTMQNGVGIVRNRRRQHGLCNPFDGKSHDSWGRRTDTPHAVAACPRSARAQPLAAGRHLEMAADPELGDTSRSGIGSLSLTAMGFDARWRTGRERMRNGIILLGLLLCSVTPASAQVSIGIGLPHLSIGINLPLYPELVPVPGYPVYYAPQVEANYFFYDGMYWVYQEDNWYSSSWYNGPWGLVAPEVVPLFVLRIPVRYYRRAPAYFRGWPSNAPPRWGEHWGNRWAQRRSGWDQWNRSAVPARPPLPLYQRNYAGDRYPRVEQQRALQRQNFHYQPRDPLVRQQYQGLRGTSSPAQAPRGTPDVRHESPSPARVPEHADRPPSVRQNRPTAAHAGPPPHGGPQQPQQQRSEREKGGEHVDGHGQDDRR
jgi:hypothetical protein